MDALNSRYLDYCAPAEDMPSFEQTSRVLLVNGRSIFDDGLDWQKRQLHILELRKPNGTLSAPYNASSGSTNNEVIIDAGVDFTPIYDGSIEPPLYMFCINERLCNGVLIRDIIQSSIEQVSVTAELDDDRVYLYGNSLAPAA